MRPILQDKNKNYKMWIVYGLILLICLICIGIAVYNQYFKDDKIGVIFGITNSEDEDLYNELKNNFSTIFTNGIDNFQSENLEIEKINKKFNYVVTRHKYKEEQENYTLDVCIPIININKEEIKNYNQEIESKYKKQVEEIKISTGDIYNVRYKCYIQDNILSLIIYSELIEKNDNQRIMVETYNYDLVNNKEISLEEILSLKEIKIADANNKIISEIEEIQKKNDSLTELGYNMYKRDISSNIYKVSNIEQYFLGKDGNIYVVFAYGNYDQTSEMDIVIFMNK